MMDLWECARCGDRDHFGSFHDACDICGSKACANRCHPRWRRALFGLLKLVMWWRER